jgi:predicted RecB family nuclease
MKISSGKVRLSASDLSNHLACRHATSLDMAVATGGRCAPQWLSPDLWVLQERGMAHENAYLEHLQEKGLFIQNLRDVGDERNALDATRAAMETGVDAIAQATLADGRWFGRADLLRRIERPSRLGVWSYEVYDCKLASETKAGTILQLSLYSELVSAVQGIAPEQMYVVPPGVDFEAEEHRFLDFSAYYRYVKARLEIAVEPNGGADETYPEPVPHCSVCRWFVDCEAWRRGVDHLSLVAGISKLQRKQWLTWDTKTVEALASFPLPLQHRPRQGSAESYVRVREQARVQVAGRNSRAPVYEVLEFSDQHGLARLPEPSAGDLFFDLEGDPFVGNGGREYLFGFVVEETAGDAEYRSQWSLVSDQEKKAFEWFVDFVMERWAGYPAMHIYHFTAYEPSALKRLMGRYATREEEIDRMLRAGLFIDLHTVLKRSVRASVEEYSLKALEVFHSFTRCVPLDCARKAMRQMEHRLELGESGEVDESVRETISGYNADDCLSTRSLRDWLERERQVLVEKDYTIPRPTASDGAPSDLLSERQQRTDDLVAQLTGDIPADPEMRTEEQAARRLLADLLDWHRRENKVACWEYFRLKDLTDEELLDERAAVAGLRYLERVDMVRKIPTDRYAFDKQETDVRCGDTLCEKGQKIGEVVAIDVAARNIEIKKMKKTGDIHPQSVFVDARGPKNDVMADALFRLGNWIQTNGLDAPGVHRAARDLLLRRPPHLVGCAGDLVRCGESTVDAAKRLVVSLEDSALAIQGPPGAGKTFTGARMILELARRGKRVGISATSHKVIGNLLKEVVAAAAEDGLSDLKCLQKVTDRPEQDPPGITLTTDNKDARAAIQRDIHILGATSWLWSSEDFFEAVDVLFVDEAGQMALANVLAVSQAAKSIVLLGDPQQLEQPLRASHPEGAEVSALEHLIDGAKTIPADMGLFLEKTWRMHPKLCEFTSEVFYEGRLQSRDGLENQRVEGHPWLGGSGLWFIPVIHEGNRNASSEEVERIAGIVDGLLQPDVTWVDDKLLSRTLRLEDILIVAPYNAQVSDLSDRLPNARVGTVDKFQGQQAPIVIYSLATSSPEEAPRGSEFLYSLNRLNVATSRAQAIVIVVASPRLLEPECRTPRQMQLANALCRYAELAHVADTAICAVKSDEHRS